MSTPTQVPTEPIPATHSSSIEQQKSRGGAPIGAPPLLFCEATISYIGSTDYISKAHDRSKPFESKRTHETFLQAVWA